MSVKTNSAKPDMEMVLTVRSDSQASITMVWFHQQHNMVWVKLQTRSWVQSVAAVHWLEISSACRLHDVSPSHKGRTKPTSTLHWHCSVRKRQTIGIVSCLFVDSERASNCVPSVTTNTQTTQVNNARRYRCCMTSQHHVTVTSSNMEAHHQRLHYAVSISG